MKVDAAIVGLGSSAFGRGLPQSQLALAADAFREALEDSGLERDQIDGLAINLGWPLGLDYDRVAEAFGLDVRYVNQTWLHGRFTGLSLQNAALAVSAGLADVVACVTAVSFTRQRDMLAGPGDMEGTREEGGSHGESPPYGMTSPAGGSAMAMQRYMALYGATSEQLAAVPIALRKHARLNPRAVMTEPMDIDSYLSSRPIAEPLRLFDCSIITDGAVVVFVTTGERARDLRQRPVRIAGMQGISSGREEFMNAPRGLGINQQTSRKEAARESDQAAFRMAGIDRSDIDGFYTYDSFSPAVLFALERFGYCGPGEAAEFVQNGRIELGGELPVNTNGGLLSEAHIGGWNSIAEIVRQLRGTAGPTQVSGARWLQWGTVRGDAVVFGA